MNAAAKTGFIPVGKCKLDLRSHQLADAKGREVALTAMEFDLLKALVERPNQVLSRDELLTLTRKREWEPFDRSIDILIGRLRRKVEDDPDRPSAIRTIRAQATCLCLPGRSSRVPRFVNAAYKYVAPR